MNRGILIFFLSCIILSNFISAQPPFQQTTDNGILLETPIFESFQEGKAIEFNIHAHNLSNGLLLTNSTTQCSLHLYNSSGEHRFSGEMSFEIPNLDFYSEIDGGNFTKGSYAVLFYCNASDIGGFLEYTFSITPSGEEASYNYLIASILLILSFIGFGFLIYKNKEKMDDEKYWSSMFKKYMNKNYLKLSAIIIWYNIKKNIFVIYYLIGLIDSIIIYDIARVYNLTSVEPIFNILLTLYFWGSLIVVIILFGNVQEWVKEWLESIQKINWGELTLIK